MKAAKAARMKAGQNLRGSVDNDEPEGETRPWNDTTKGRGDCETTTGWGKHAG